MRATPSFSEGKFSFVLYSEVDSKRRYDQNCKVSLVHCSSLLPVGRFHALTSMQHGLRHMQCSQEIYKSTMQSIILTAAMFMAAFLASWISECSEL